MSRVAHILCPVDFSDISQHALDHAAAIAQRDQARLTVLYVFANLPSMDVPPLVLSPADRERIRDDLRRMCAKVSPSVPIAHRVVEAERVYRTILAEQVDLGADLLVLGTHGRSGFDRLLLGSTTEKMLRRAPCPLLTVPARQGETAPGPLLFTRILCAIDFSPSSLRALSFAESLAKEADASLTVLHVLEPAAATATTRPITHAPPGRLVRSARPMVIDRLRAAISPIASRLIQYEATDAAIVTVTTAACPDRRRAASDARSARPSCSRGGAPGGSSGESARESSGELNHGWGRERPHDVD